MAQGDASAVQKRGGIRTLRFLVSPKSNYPGARSVADANSYRNLTENSDLAVAAAVVVSPLLNLAPSCASGPTVNQSQPIMALGTSSLTGRAMLSLAPDRRSIEVSVHLDGGAAPSAIQLRRIASHHLHGSSRSYDYDLLIIEVISAMPRAGPLCLQKRFSLSDRGSFLPFERVSDLRKLGIDVSALIASSIDGLRVEGAPHASSSDLNMAGYLAERLLMEIRAAERSVGVLAACKHLELANLYARRLGISKPQVAA
jgi:hypothetical protein